MAHGSATWRPLPEKIVVVAFPTACSQASQPASPAMAEGDFFLVQADSKDIDLPRPVMDWLSLSPATAVAAGLSRVDYRAADNTRPARSLQMPVVVRGTHYAVTFLQQPGLLVQMELTRTLNCPLNIDCLVAVTFIADLLKKIPIPPIKLIVMAIVVLAIVALGFVVSALRHAFAAVPEPKPLSTDTNGVPITIVPGVAVSQGLPLAHVAAEDQTIALQTVKEIYWLIKQAI